MKKYRVFILALYFIFFICGILSGQTQHFIPSWQGQQPYSPMTIFIIEAKYKSIDLVADDEIGIFDGDQCVGAGVVTNTVSTTNFLEIIVSKNDGLSGLGFTENNRIIYKIWKEITDTEATIDSADVQYYNLQTGAPIDPVIFSGLGTAAVGINNQDDTGITVTYPNGGESWAKNIPQTITWTSKNISGKVKIELSTNNGSSWETIADSTENNGEFSWTPLPQYVSDNCLIKIISLTNNLIFDNSDGMFAITDEEYVHLWIDKYITGSANNTIIIPIKCSDISGQSVFSADITISYDANILEVTDTELEGTLLDDAGWGTPTKNMITNQITLAMAGSNPLAGSGNLIKIIFNIKGSTGDSSLIQFKSATLNEGDPQTYTSDGLFKVSDNFYKINGKFGYYSNPAKMIEGVDIQLTGAQNSSINSNSLGEYEFQNLTTNDYIITPQKDEESHSKSINAYDASFVLRHSVGSYDLSPYQKIAGDVSGNGEVTSYDASFILRYCVEIINSFPVGTDWTFIPSDFSIDQTNWASAPCCRGYAPLNSDSLNQDFYGILYGDVSGNWSGTTLAKTSDIVDITYCKMEEKENGNLLIPLELNISEDLYSGKLKLTFNKNTFKYLSCKIDDLSKGIMITGNNSNGILNLAIASASPISQEQLKIDLLFRPLKSYTTSEHALELSELILNEKLVSLTSSHDQADNFTPLKWQLNQNYPNPFNSTTLISYEIPNNSHVFIEVFNLLGQKLKTLTNEYKEAGTYQTLWDGTDSQGHNSGSGIYIYKMKAGNFVAAKKMALIF